MYRKTSGALLAITLSLGISLLALAETTAEDAFKYRASVMKSLGGHIGATSMTLRGLVEDRGFLPHHAAALANGVKELDYLFPEGSNVDESEALPVIWQEPEEFAGAISKVQAAAAGFAEAVESGDADAINVAFREMGGACRGCHDSYRVKHEH